MVPNVPWHRAPAVRGPRATKEKIGYLIVIYIGNQITDIYAIRYDTSTVHGLLVVYCYTRVTCVKQRHYQLHIYKRMPFHTFTL